MLDGEEEVLGTEGEENIEEDLYGVPQDPNPGEPEPDPEPEDDEVDEDVLKALVGEEEKPAEEKKEPDYKDDPDYKAFMEFKAAQAAAAGGGAEPVKATTPAKVTPEQFDSIFDADKGVETLNDVLAGVTETATREALAAAKSEFEEYVARVKTDMWTQNIMVVERMLGAYKVFQDHGSELAGNEELFGRIYHKEMSKGQPPEEAAQNAMRIFSATAKKAEAIKKTAGRSVDLRGGEAAPKTRVTGARPVPSGAPSDAQAEAERNRRIAETFARGNK
jgi:hypothetical protein